MFVGIGFIILQSVLSKIQNPKEKYVSMEDRELFQTDSFNRRFAKLGFILALSLPPLFGMIFGILSPMSSTVADGLISFVVLAMLVVVSTAMHYWHLSGISKAEIDYRKYKKDSEPGVGLYGENAG